MGQLVLDPKRIDRDQVLVADGGSTDGVEKMLKKHFMPEVEFYAVKKHTSWNRKSVV